MNQCEYGKSVVDPFGHREDDHYFMDSVPGYEEEKRKNKMDLDFNRFKDAKEKLFEKYKNFNAVEIYRDVFQKIKAYTDHTEDGSVNIHNLRNFYQKIGSDKSYIEYKKFSGTLEELMADKKFDVDRLLEAMVKLDY